MQDNGWQQAWVSNPPGLNFRNGAGLSNGIIEWFPNQTALWVDPAIKSEADGIIWWLASNGNRHGFVASKYLSLNAPAPIPTPQPQPVPPIWKLVGLHIMDGPNNDAVEGLLYRHPVGAVTVINNVGLANRLKNAHPDMAVIFRRVEGDNDPAPAGGLVRWQELWPITKQLHPDIYIQIANEWYSKGWGSIDLGRFVNIYLDAIDAAISMGRKIVVGDFEMGSPEPVHLPTLARLFDRAAEVGFPVNYHAYNPFGSREITDTAEWYAMRWRMIADLHPTLKFVFGEAGMGDANWLGTAHFIEQIGRFEAMLTPYRERVLGACWWTVGGQGMNWARSSIDEGLAEYEKWVAG